MLVQDSFRMPFPSSQIGESPSRFETARNAKQRIGPSSLFLVPMVFGTPNRNGASAKIISPSAFDCPEYLAPEIHEILFRTILCVRFGRTLRPIH